MLATTALAATVGVTTLAACSDDSEPTLPGEEFPAVDEWLTETQVGGATPPSTSNPTGGSG